MSWLTYGGRELHIYPKVRGVCPKPLSDVAPHKEYVGRLESQRLHSSHTFLAGIRSGCYFWTYSKYPLGISGVPPPNLINSSYINLKFDQEHLQHPFVFQQQSHLWTPLLALIYLILSYVSALLLIKFWFLCCCGITNLASILCRIHLSKLLKNLLI